MRNWRRSGYTLVEMAVVLAICGILAAIVFPVWTRAQDNRHRAECQSNLKVIGLAMLQYAQDNDTRFPLVASNPVNSSSMPLQKPFGWADAIQPYLYYASALQCPSDKHSRSADATRDGFTDYWYNANLNAVELKSVMQPSSTFLLGDGNDGNHSTNARYALTAEPLVWKSSLQSPALRHFGKINHAFVDGHVASYTNFDYNFKVKR